MSQRDETLSTRDLASKSEPATADEETRPHESQAPIADDAAGERSPSGVETVPERRLPPEQEEHAADAAERTDGDGEPSSQRSVTAATHTPRTAEAERGASAASAAETSPRPAGAEAGATPTEAETHSPPAGETQDADEADADGAALLSAEDGADVQARWEGVQTQFVDDPRRAVEDADALVAHLMQQLADGFARERERLEGQWSRGEDVSTEELRVVLQRYRSFFRRLLSA